MLTDETVVSIKHQKGKEQSTSGCRSRLQNVCALVEDDAVVEWSRERAVPASGTPDEMSLTCDRQASHPGGVAALPVPTVPNLTKSITGEYSAPR